MTISPNGWCCITNTRWIASSKRILNDTWSTIHGFPRYLAASNKLHPDDQHLKNPSFKAHAAAYPHFFEPFIHIFQSNQCSLGPVCPRKIIQVCRIYKDCLILFDLNMKTHFKTTSWKRLRIRSWTNLRRYIFFRPLFEQTNMVTIICFQSDSPFNLQSIFVGYTTDRILEIAPSPFLISFLPRITIFHPVFTPPQSGTFKLCRFQVERKHILLAETRLNVPICMVCT